MTNFSARLVTANDYSWDENVVAMHIEILDDTGIVIAEVIYRFAESELPNCGNVNLFELHERFAAGYSVEAVLLIAELNLLIAKEQHEEFYSSAFTCPLTDESRSLSFANSFAGIMRVPPSVGA